MSKTVCAIVGAGEGLGRALAEKFARQGFDLALISRSEAGSAAAMEAARKSSANVRYFTADVVQPETLETALAQVADEMGEIEVLIYNARGNEMGASDPLDISYAELDQVFRIEVVGAFAAAKSVLPTMIERSRGSIFFSSATAAYRGSGTLPLYAIGKFGLRGLSQSLSKAYAKQGVHVVHVRLDCDLDVPVMRKFYEDRGYDQQNLASTDAVAESYWLTHQQPKAAWSNEIELRPHTEEWTY